MLNLQRSKGQKLYVGDEELTVIEIANSYVILKYQDQLHVIKKDQIYNLDPQTVVKYNRRSGTEARLSFKSILPIYRSEIYEQKNSKSVT